MVNGESVLETETRTLIMYSSIVRVLETETRTLIMYSFIVRMRNDLREHALTCSYMGIYLN